MDPIPFPTPPNQEGKSFCISSASCAVKVIGSGSDCARMVRAVAAAMHAMEIGKSPTCSAVSEIRKHPANPDTKAKSIANDLANAPVEFFQKMVGLAPLEMADFLDAGREFGIPEYGRSTTSPALTLSHAIKKLPLFHGCYRIASISGFDAKSRARTLAMVVDVTTSLTPTPISVDSKNGPDQTPKQFVMEILKQMPIGVLEAVQAIGDAPRSVMFNEICRLGLLHLHCALCGVFLRALKTFQPTDVIAIGDRKVWFERIGAKIRLRIA